MTPVLRAAREDDAPSIAAIYSFHVLNGVSTYEETAPGAAEMATRIRTILAGGYPYLVAEFDGRTAGYAYISAWNERSGYRFTAQDSIYIDEALRRRGLGRLLLAALLDEARARGLKQMMAIVGGASPPSIALHEALGFRRIGLANKIGFKFGRWLDTAYLQKAL